jgi:hypothetical protein
MGDKDKPTDSERDEPVKIDLDPELALRALIKTGPHPEPVERDPASPSGDPLKE